MRINYQKRTKLGLWVCLSLINLTTFAFAGRVQFRDEPQADSRESTPKKASRVLNDNFDELTKQLYRGAGYKYERDNENWITCLPEPNGDWVPNRDGGGKSYEGANICQVSVALVQSTLGEQIGLDGDMLGGEKELEYFGTDAATLNLKATRQAVMLFGPNTPCRALPKIHVYNWASFVGEPFLAKDTPLTPANPNAHIFAFNFSTINGLDKRALIEVCTRLDWVLSRYLNVLSIVPVREDPYDANSALAKHTQNSLKVGLGGKDAEPKPDICIRGNSIGGEKALGEDAANIVSSAVLLLMHELKDGRGVQGQRNLTIAALLSGADKNQKWQENDRTTLGYEGCGNLNTSDSLKIFKEGEEWENTVALAESGNEGTSFNATGYITEIITEDNVAKGTYRYPIKVRKPCSYCVTLKWDSLLANKESNDGSPLVLHRADNPEMEIKLLNGQKEVKGRMAMGSNYITLYFDNLKAGNDYKLVVNWDGNEIGEIIQDFSGYFPYSLAGCEKISAKRNLAALLQ